MVLAPNAYWLNFFLKREINVVCWNYRGYGESDCAFFEHQSAAKAKLDAERVLATSLTKLGLRGKIGVYGRSIGGIAACHLANKY
jgi:pimeloyl-ACP methyl ester carboxylesterase